MRIRNGRWRKRWNFRSIRRKVVEKGDQISEFDKDDDDAVAFVTATAQLRCLNYDIEYMSRFDAKGVAGNIVHAVATTNASRSGLIVLEALKILNAQKHLKEVEEEGKNDGLIKLANSRYTFVGNFNAGKQLLQPLAPERAKSKMRRVLSRYLPADCVVTCPRRP